MAIWRTGLLAGLAGLFTVGCATSSPLLVRDPTRRFDLPGFSILPPQGADWVINVPIGPISDARKDPQEVFTMGEIFFVKQNPAGLPPTILAGARPLDASDLKEASAAELQRKSESGWGVTVRRVGRSRLVSAKASVDTSLGPNCVRFEQSEEEPGASGSTVLSTTRGVRCLHPHWPKYAIGVFYTQWRRPGEQLLPIETEVEPVLRSLRFTPDRPSLTLRIPVGDSPRGLALGEGSVWVTNAGADSVTRIDRQTSQVTTTIAVGKAPFGVAVGDHAVWVANQDGGTVSRIDPSTNQVVATVPVGGRPLRVALSPGAVWIANRSGNTVSRIDPATNQVVATIPVGQEPGGLAVAEGAVWVANSKDHTVSRIDPATNRVVGEPIKIGSFGGASPTGIAGGEGAVWVAEVVGEVQGGVHRIDPKTNKPEFATGVAPRIYGIAAGGGAVWVTTSYAQSVARIDPQTKKRGKFILVGGQLFDVAVEDGALWVVDGNGNTVARLDLPTR